MMLMRCRYSFVLMMFWVSILSAQPVRFTASLDTNVIRIGQQTFLRIQMEYSSQQIQSVFFPSIPDSLSGVEVVERSTIDSSANNGIMLKRQTIAVTAFDSGSYRLPALTAYYRLHSDTTLQKIKSNTLFLQVQSVKVDTTGDFKDIKSPLDVPITFEELLPYIAGGLLLVGLIVAGVYYYRRFRKQPSEITQIPVVPTRKPHEIAMEELAKLQHEKLWQQGLLKEYHTRLTDIIRVYIEQCFGMKTLEKTSDEILDDYRRALKNAYVAPGTSELLRFILHQADLVKFAKFTPIDNDNEKSLALAKEFITLTTPEGTAQELPDQNTPDTTSSTIS